MSYKDALANYNKAKAAHEKTRLKLSAAKDELEAAKHEMEIECGACHKTTKVKEVEIVVQKSGGWYSSSDDEHHYHTWTVWVCPHCTEPRALPSETEGPFAKEYGYSYGFDHYVKAVHEWYSDSERCHGRVLQLLGPYLDRKEKEKAQRLRQIKIEEAKKLLAEEGILEHS